MSVGTGAASSATDWIAAAFKEDATTTGAPRRTADDRAGRSNDRLRQPGTSVTPRAGTQPTQAPDPPSRTQAPSRTPEPSRTPASKPAWVKPISDYKVTSCYGMRGGRMHQGVDLAAANGTPIVAAAAGTVVEAGGTGDGYGNKVVISHGGNIHTLYGHASRVLVSKGDQVAVGERIALEGSTGHSTGPHLHFEVHRGLGNRTNPVPWMADHGVDLGGC